MKRLLFGVSVACLFAGGAQALTVWDMSGGVGSAGANIGSGPVTFGAISGDIGLGITASGLTGVNLATPQAMFEKNGGGDEVGLGLTNDAAHENEITVGSAILVDFTNGVNAGANAFSWQFNSTTPSGLPQGEKWIVVGSNSSSINTFLTIVGQGTNDESVHTVLGIPFKFYLFEAVAGNVLLAEVDGSGGNLTPVAAVPEPATWAMMILGFMGLAFAFRQRRRTASLA